MSLPIYFDNVEETLSAADNNLPVVKLLTSNKSAFGGSALLSQLLPDNVGGSVSAAKYIGADNSGTYNAKDDILAKMALLYNANGQFVTPNFGQAVTNPSQPFNFIGMALTSTQAANDNWTPKASSVSPSARKSFGMAYMTTIKSMILFGGFNTGSPLNDTWSWDGIRWTQLTPATSPTARRNFSMVYDSVREVIVLFGGIDVSDTILNDTWEFDGATWAHIIPTDSPLARYDHGLAFDSKRGVTVLFGGATFISGYEDTLEYDGTTWTTISTASAPAFRSGFAFTFDSARNKMVLFGGIGVAITTTLSGSVGVADKTINVAFVAGFPTSGVIIIDSEHIRYEALTPSSFIGCTRGVEGTVAATHLSLATVSAYALYGDTWEYDGTDWKQVFVNDPLPSLRSQGKLIFNATEKTAFLFGGLNNPVGNTGDLGDTWKYDGISWTQLPVFGPTMRGSFGFEYDPFRDRSVLFGGKNTISVDANHDTWEFGKPLRPINVQTTGDGYVYYDLNPGRPIPVIGDFLGPSATIGAVTPLYDGYSPVFGIATEAPLIAYQTALNGGINNVTTTITVLSTSAFPSAGTLIIDSEQISYTGTTSTTFTGCTRGINGTSNVGHTDGTVVFSLTQTVINGNVVGVIKMHIRPFYGFIPPLSPSITSFSPSSAIVGDEVTVNGSVFIGTTGLTVDDDGYTTSATFDVISNNQITFVVPAGAQQGTITVTNAQGNSTSGSSFSTLPTIQSVVPPSGSIDTTIVIHGHTFTYATDITFDGYSQPVFTIDDDTQITTTIPAGATSGALVVEITYPLLDIHTATYDNFDVVEPPVISSIAPLIGPVGSSSYTTLDGSINNSIATITVATTAGFLSAGTILIDSEQIVYTGTTGTTFTGCTRGVNGTVATSHSNDASVSALTTNPNGYVAIYGSGLEVTGAALDGYGVIEFVDVATMTQILPAARTIFNDSSISVIVPNPGVAQPSKAYYVRITTDGGVYTSSQSFTLIPAPKFLTAANTTLNGGISSGATTITVVDTSVFPSASNFFIGNEQISYTGTSPTTFTGCARGINGTSAVSHLDTAAVTVKTFISQSNNAQGIAGETVRIFGDFGFTGISSVSFAGYSSSFFHFVNDGYITAVVPVISSATDVSGPISITSIGGTKNTADAPTTNPTSFAILQQPTITAIYNAASSVHTGTQSGKTGDTIVITGTNLLSVSTVAFTGSIDGYAFATFSTINDTTINATVPAGVSGILIAPDQGPITITKGELYAISDQNFLYYAAPTISAITPAVDTNSYNGGYGTAVSITGTYLTMGVDTPAVVFGTIAVPPSGFGSVSGSNVNVIVPSGANGTSMTLTTAGGTITASFRTLQPVSISAFRTNYSTSHYAIDLHTAAPGLGTLVDVFGANFVLSGMLISVISPYQGNASIAIPSYTFFDSTHIQFSSAGLSSFIGYTCVIEVITRFNQTAANDNGGSYVANVNGLNVIFVIT